MRYHLNFSSEGHDFVQTSGLVGSNKSANELRGGIFK